MADYRRGFDDLRSEIAVDALPVAGTLPNWLAGTLVRNGPAQFAVGSTAYNHWFDGLAMLHAFRIEAGEVAYRNRFLDTQSRREAVEAGRITRSEFATDPCRSIFGRIMTLFNPSLTDNASIHVHRLAGQYVAMTETPLPVAFDPDTLAHAGVVRYTDDHDAPMSTAHPLVEPERGRTITYLTDFGRTCRYHLAAIDRGTARRRMLASLPVEQPSYMHSFGMTERYVILAEWPLVVDPLDLLLTGKPFIENFRWEPERGTRFRVLRKRDGAEVATCTADAAFAFHHANAFEREGYIVCDVAAYPDAQIIDDLYLDRLRAPDAHPTTGHLTRYRLPLTGGTATSERVSETMLELPRIDDRRTGRPYEVVYGVSTRDPESFTDQLVKMRPETGAATTWHEADCFPGEPVFVPRPGSSGEDDGLILSVVLNAATDTSFLLVLDAETFTEVARAPVPHAIPFGFHGRFFDTAS